MRKHIAAFVLATAAFSGAMAQTDSTEHQNTQTTVKALFEYPLAPDNVGGLPENSDWLVEHFWDNFNPKKLKSVDQAALNHAFEVFITPMQWADKEKTYDSVDRLISSAQKNPAILLQLTKAAEEKLYGPNASMWIDEIYIKFLDALLKNKKLKEIHKTRYRFQHSRLASSMIGADAPSFSFTKPDGSPGFFEPTGNYTLIEFGDPDCYDCMMAKLKLDTDSSISDLIKTGRLNVCFFTTETDEGWKEKLADYPEKWTVGATDTADEVYDLRLTPAFYIIGPDKKIKAKNIPVDHAISLVKKLSSGK